MAQWYSEGLIYADFLSCADSIPATDVLLSGSIGITYYNAASYTTLMNQVDADSPFELYPVEVPVDTETGEPVHLGPAGGLYLREGLLSQYSAGT